MMNNNKVHVYCTNIGFVCQSALEFVCSLYGFVRTSKSIKNLFQILKKNLTHVGVGLAIG